MIKLFTFASIVDGIGTNETTRQRTSSDLDTGTEVDLEMLKSINEHVESKYRVARTEQVSKSKINW